MNDTESREGLQHLKEKRRSLEDKIKTLEEETRAEKLAIDKKLVVQILEEENRTHNDAVRELEDKIANLDQQLKILPSEESTLTQTTSEPAQETSDDVDRGFSVGVLPPSEQSEVEVSREGSKKKKRNLF